MPALYNQSIELLDWKLGQHWKIAQACAPGTGFEATVLGLEVPKTLFDMDPAVIDIAFGLAFSFFVGGTLNVGRVTPGCNCCSCRTALRQMLVGCLC